MRLFTAVDPAPEVLDRLCRLVSRLQPAAPLRWSRSDGLHITLKFIGEWPAEKLALLEQALRSVPAPAPFPVHVRRLGFFPPAGAPRVFWAGVDPCTELAQLAAHIDKALEPLGAAPEQRPYHPHLTLARIADRRGGERLRDALQAEGTPDFGAFLADRFFLYESRPGPGGSVYARLGEFPWSGEV